MREVMRKPVSGIYHQVILKPARSATKTSKNYEFRINRLVDIFLITLIKDSAGLCLCCSYNEPRHVISNNVAFLQVSKTQARLCSLLLSLENPNAVR